MSFDVKLRLISAIGLVTLIATVSCAQTTVDITKRDATSSSMPVPSTTIADADAKPTPSSSSEKAPSTSTLPTVTSQARSNAAKPLARRDDRLMLGYYVPYDPTSWATLQNRADQIDLVSAQIVSIDACGNIGARDDRTLIAFARRHGIGLVPSLLTSDQGLNHRILTDLAVRDHAIDEIVSYVLSEGYDGFDLDLEDVIPADRGAYSAFVAKLSEALHQRGKILIAALPAKAYDATSGWSGAYDYRALGSYLDYAMMMTYDYSYSSSPPGSTAPYEWVDRVMAYVTSQIPSQKVLLGLAFYGYDWNTTSPGRARALIYNQALALAAKYGTRIVSDPATRSATFSYTAKSGDPMPAIEAVPPLDHEISVRRPRTCTEPLPTSTPKPRTPTPAAKRSSPTAAALQNHVVWLEDGSAVASKTTLADEYRLAGVGAWRLGQEDASVWSVLAAWQQQGR